MTVSLRLQSFSAIKDLRNETRYFFGIDAAERRAQCGKQRKNDRSALGSAQSNNN